SATKSTCPLSTMDLKRPTAVELPSANPRILLALRYRRVGRTSCAPVRIAHLSSRIRLLLSGQRSSRSWTGVKARGPPGRARRGGRGGLASVLLWLAGSEFLEI